MADITHDVADDGFHEIQLSGKQLVFLFMATTAVSVMIFLLGVLVGRDVRGERAAEPTDAALTTPAPLRRLRAAPRRAGEAPAGPEQAAPARAPAEPPSPPADDELTYRKRLESDGAAKETLKPQGRRRARMRRHSPSRRVRSRRRRRSPRRPRAPRRRAALSTRPRPAGRPGPLGRAARRASRSRRRRRPSSSACPGRATRRSS